MASSCEASCISDPNFAVVCAFLERFASSCGIEYPTFVDLQEMLENVDQVPQELIDLHIKLLRKARKTVFIEKWERALIKFCHTYSSQDGWEIERFGYKKSRLEVKIRVLKMLLEGQFDLNQKFKAQINTIESSELRTKPLGKDKVGRLYWLQTDPISNIRVYREDLDDESWTLVAKDRPSLVELLQELSGEESSAYLNLLNEDSVSLDVDKPVTDTGQNENGSIMGEEDDEKLGVNGEVNSDAQEQPINGEADIEPVNGCVDEEKEGVNSNIQDELEVGEVIEEPVIYVTGEGAGADCDAGNPDKEEEQNEHAEESAPNTSEHDLSSEKQRPTPKLWSIDTICGVNSTEMNEVKHKNFSSFSIDSVLEKKDSEATFSKYTVNCPFESNSVGDEQTSDVNLKTDINSDVVRYREASSSEPILMSSEDINNIKSNSETADNVHSLVVESSSEVSPASSKTDIGVSKKLGDTVYEAAKSDALEIPIESGSQDETNSSVLNENTSHSQTNCNSDANNLKDYHIENQNQIEEIIKSPLTEPEPSIDEKKESPIDKNSEGDIINKQTTIKENEEPLTVIEPALGENNLTKEMKAILFEEEKETVEVPKPVDEKLELKPLNVPEILKEKERVVELPSDTQTEKKLENQSITTEEEPSFIKIVAESPVIPKTPNSVDLLERDSTEKIPEEIEERKKTETTDETNTLEGAEDELEPEEIISSESKMEKSEILIRQNVKKDSEKELEGKTDYVRPVELKLELMEDQEVKEIQLPTEANFNPMDIESEKHENLQEIIKKKDSEMIEKKAVSEVEKEAEKVLSEEIEITEDKKLENDDEKKQKELQETPKAAEEKENNPAVDEVIIKPEITLQTEEFEGEEMVEKLPVDAKPEDVVEAGRKTLEKMDDERDAKQENEKNENTEFRTGVKDKEEKKLKRELVVAIEKMESVPDIKKEIEKETDNEKLSEDKAPRKLTRSSAKTKESEVEKEEEKGTKEEESDKSKKEKKELRRLSRTRRGVEENFQAEETPRMTRGRRKSVGLEETPKQTKGRRGRGKAKEEETEKEVEEEEKVEAVKDENEKSEEEEGEENEKEIEAQKPQARRGRKPKNRRRRFFNFQRKKIREENEKEHEKKEDDEKKNDDVKKEEGEDKEKKENEEKKERKRRRKRDEATLLRDRAAAELKLLEVTEDAETPSTIRQSRRIAQIKLKEEAERRRVEALQLESFKNEKNKKGKKKRKSKHDSDSGDEERPDKDEEDSDDEILKKERKRRKKKDKLKFNELNPWLSSTESSTVDEEEEELDDEPHEDDELVFKSDHEFSPESDVEDPDYKPIKRARTAKVEESEDKGGKYDDTACEKCGNKDHPEWILLCDKCDKGWHASCVRPALMVVPEGDWFCPPCEHIFLIEKLKESLAQYDKSQKQRENEELRRKRLAFVGISLDNVLPPAKKIPKEDNEDDEKSGSESNSESESSESDSGSSGSTEPVYQLRERRSNVTSYRYNEYDELIKSALKDEIEAVKGAGNSGRGKDISNIVNAERQKENEKPEKEENEGETLPVKEQDGNEEEKPKEKSKKDEDGDYDVETEEEEEEDDENIADEIPPVVPKNTGLKKKRSKSVKITSLDFTSEEEDNNSDSDFKGTSDEEESECSLPSESESSEEIGRRRKGFDGPVRRSTRARVSRYDRDFINDDSSDDDEPKRKRQRSWDSTESSDSDRSWGRKKRKKGGISSRAKRFSCEKKKKKKQKRRVLKSDDDEEHRPAKKSKSRKIIYGGLDEEPILARRTRGKKINYQEMNGSDSEDEQPRKTARVIESDDDFVAENDKDEEAQNAESEEIESGVDEDEDSDPNKKKKPEEKKKKILEKIKKKKWVIPDPDDFSEDDLMEEKQLDELNEELEDLDEEEEEILGNILEKGDVPINELRDAVKRAKEERKKKKETETGKCQPETLLPRTYPPIPAHMEFGGGKFPKIGKVKITPSRAELASLGGIPPQGGLPAPGAQPGFNASGFPMPEKQEEKAEMLLRTLPGEKGLGDPNIPTNHSKPDQRPYPYPMEAPPVGPLTMMAMMNSQKGDDSPVGAKNGPPHYSYQGMAGYPPNIPTTVMGISDIEAQGKKKPGPKPGTKMKKKIDDGDDNAASGDEFKMESMKAVRGRVKKPEEGVSTVQPPSQFPPADGGSVITRMLNAPQYESNQFVLRNAPFRPIHFPTPPRPPPPIRVRVPGPMFHTSHPHDPSPSGGGPINIPTTKPSPPSPTFNRAPVPIIQRFPDPRFNVQGSPSRPEFPAFGNYYGNFPQPEEPGFQNPPSYPEQFPEGAPPPPKPFEDETGGEFGGLASYFASQREEDLDT